MNNPLACVVKNDIKLTEYKDSTYSYEDRFFLQSGCVGFYLTTKQLRDIATVVNYYLNAEDISEVKVMIGGEHVTLE